MHEVGYGTDTKSVLSKHETYFTSCSPMGVELAFVPGLVPS